MAAAFATAPRFAYMLLDETSRPAKLRWYWAAVIRATQSIGVVHVAAEEGSDTIRGVAIWEAPSVRNGRMNWLRSGLWQAPVRLGIGSWRRRRALAPLLRDLAPGDPHWYLSAIGVDPSGQRSGYGRALLETMHRRIDDGHIAVFLDTSADWNLPYHERFGFQISVESRLPNGIPVWGMIRPPAAA
jgi:ribosomal protein S18 acetylase RimI-like enzyme